MNTQDIKDSKNLNAPSKGNVPALRFPEFSGEWKKLRLSDFATKITKKNKGNIFKNVLSNSANLGLVPQGNYFDREIANTENTDGYYVICNGDFVYNPRKSTTAPFGPVNIYEGDDVGIISPLYLCFSVHNIFPKFLYYRFKGSAWHSYVYSHGDSGVRFDRVSIKDDVFFDMPIYKPTQDEQIKIATLLQLIDERISIQSRIIEDLKKLKSAIVETLFCAPKESMPAKRLSSYCKEWRLVKLSDMCQRIQIKNAGRQCQLVLTIAAQHGLVNQEDFFNKTVASENLEGYYLLQKGDFAYNKSYSGDYAWGAVKRLERYKQGVLSPLYICFRPDAAKVNADYLVHYFESKKWHKGIADIAGEGARNHGLLNISVIDFFNTIHRIPDLDEQKDIAQALNSLSSKLSCEQQIMQNLTKQRNYLLHKMFI